jgi:hypothetical protein
MENQTARIGWRVGNWQLAISHQQRPPPPSSAREVAPPASAVTEGAADPACALTVSSDGRRAAGVGRRAFCLLALPHKQLAVPLHHLAPA